MNQTTLGEAVIDQWKNGEPRKIPFIHPDYVMVDAAKKIIEAFIHEQPRRDDILPGWEFWGILPSGERIYASTKDELRQRIFDAVVARLRK